MLEYIKKDFTESIQTKIAALEELPKPVEKAANMMIEALIRGNKVMTCGNAGSDALAQYLASQLINRHERHRPPLPALCLSGESTTLTAISNDFSFADIYSKKVKALGQGGDILVAICSNGNSENIINAMQVALTRDMTIIALTGNDGGEMAGFIGVNDVEIRVSSARTARIQEVHLLVVHSLCSCIDNALFPVNSEES
ncbi:SIS domain-containing protein [Glaciecola sp. XM2]|jgi:DnaA initiator-associating protein|uniref:D-sedoheptulose-7-phosphate isomerase n=1 Tax=Glaciecola sp. XM2 TaxID=1914931 RepID=UPI001BDEF905|nr:SIS domain-containing protein [Glaciecola sp. XM2]MBT1451082.1 SIS domain-containing protein [Glaciecola sp. XM2]